MRSRFPLLYAIALSFALCDRALVDAIALSFPLCDRTFLSLMRSRFPFLDAIALIPQQNPKTKSV
ncbi:MAG: hypothetical protein F6K56_45485 [Moorea sp. SIO3G5]|nr:hypothetical protein [Moorena sp. SIO3G5]